MLVIYKDGGECKTVKAKKITIHDTTLTITVNNHHSIMLNISRLLGVEE